MVEVGGVRVDGGLEETVVEGRFEYGDGEDSEEDEGGFEVEGESIDSVDEGGSDEIEGVDVEVLVVSPCHNSKALPPPKQNPTTKTRYKKHFILVKPTFNL
ncbi:hypothetical protein GLAREA_10383 [Glarea lozoyensis ATCC 20868]|uniref:Uncharacterized protein n=1 Tax=Glarea lozoyensis (strain ATCC 20868 / MF5171) TaxID=1116229 RepID=S3DC67_GLAL2|nr:uncharacterized protein GLAREA_10383 [Glarea lozoyensis ATCC 20868]EPE34689.1 hypothetical protein GLAREA_10383 [Glarea lozoyensis ATCC 20868]